MAFTNRQVEYPNRFVLYDDEGNELGRYTLVRDEGEIIEEGTPLTADNLNAEITSASQNAASTAVARINQAVTILDALSSPSFFIASSLILYFSIFPATFIGNESTKSIYRGTLWRAIFAAI